jgi:hypothetical protein
MSIPFTLYDFFAYLSTGALWLLGIDYAFGLKWILDGPADTGHNVAWVIIAYVLGHINSHAAAFVFEENVIAKWLGYPSINLFEATKNRGRVVSRIFAHYLTPLAGQTAARILDRYQALSNGREPGDSMFNFCFAVVKERSAVSYGRLQNFLAIYGFARNMSFAALLLAGVFVVAAIHRGLPHFWLLAAGSLAAAAVLFWRYLKFFRVFSLEVFTSLIALKD